ncbi:MAG: hypothetical protein ACOY93_18745 [Bacillota bacterium]
MGQRREETRYDWLFGYPHVPWGELEDWVADRLEADPEARAISDDEAEAFFCAAYILRAMPPAFRATLCRGFGVRYSGTGPKTVRFTTLGLLRKWKEERLRNVLLDLLPNASFEKIPIPADRPELWTDEYMRELYHRRLNIVWLVRVRRYLGRTEDLDQFLDSVAEWAADEYNTWLDVSRLNLRRLVYGERQPAAEAAAAAAPAPVSWEELQERDREAGTLRQEVRRMERGRKELKRRARQAEQRARAMLSQARGEVEAVRRAIEERAAAHQQERAALLQRFEQERHLLRLQREAIREAFLKELAEIPRSKVLAGHRIRVTDPEEEELCRLLVESLGATYQPEGGGIELSAARGLPALEGALRDLALRRVLIRCDGLYRRKEGRYGVAVAALQVRAGWAVLHEKAEVVHCGPLAGSLMAEYGALAMALHWLLLAGPPPGARVEILSDCRSMVSRLRRTQQVRRKRGCVTLDALVRRGFRALARRGVQVELRWVPRDEVEVVDRLCDRGYRNLEWYHRRGRRRSVPLKRFLSAVKPPARRSSEKRKEGLS